MSSRRDFIAQVAALGLLAPGGAAARAASLICVYGNDYAPWCWGEGSSAYGLAPALLAEFFGKVLGMHSAHQVLPWKRAQAEVEGGRADVLCTVPTPERRRYCHASQEPMYATGARLFVSRASRWRGELAQVRERSALHARKAVFASYLGGAWLGERVPREQIRFAPDLEHCIKLLASGLADAMLDNRLVLHHKIAHMGLQEQIDEGQFDLDVIAYHLLLARRSRNAGLIERIDAELPVFRTSAIYADIVRRATR
ncbi:MAG: transporter substrate-binding domain-containing protein [Pseudomonadota bacterium]